MSVNLPEITVRHFHNPRAHRQEAYGTRREILSLASAEDAHRVIASWPGYAPTPLVELPALAAALGVGSIRYKDESRRFGLGSFKALGGAYAVYRLLEARVRQATGADTVSPADLMDGRYRAITEAITVTCATDGNHGRSVAWGARTFGCRCVIYIHATVSPGRAAAIEAFGARVVRTPGNYDDSVRQAARDAETHARVVVSDTSYPGYLDIPRYVMQGYTVMALETRHQQAEPPSHIFIQGGVGGLAAAVIGHYWEALGAWRPRMVVVEPDRADCIYQSAVAGRPVAVAGDLDTVMAGLACGEVSLLAWDILENGADHLLVIDDPAALGMMGLLADGWGDDPPLVAGESAVAGLAGLVGCARNDELARQLGLDGDSRILVIGSEGDTDPRLYEQIVGRPAARVRGE